VHQWLAGTCPDSGLEAVIRSLRICWRDSGKSKGESGIARPGCRAPSSSSNDGAQAEKAERAAAKVQPEAAKLSIRKTARETCASKNCLQGIA